MTVSQIPSHGLEVIIDPYQPLAEVRASQETMAGPPSQTCASPHHRQVSIFLTHPGNGWRQASGTRGQE